MLSLKLMGGLSGWPESPLTKRFQSPVRSALEKVCAFAVNQDGEGVVLRKIGEGGDVFGEIQRACAGCGDGKFAGGVERIGAAGSLGGAVVDERAPGDVAGASKVALPVLAMAARDQLPFMSALENVVERRRRGSRTSNAAARRR